MTLHYTIHKYHGELFVKRSWNEYIPLDELEHLIAELTKTAEHMREDATQETLYAHARERFIGQACKNAEWIFAPDQSSWDKFKGIGCVYFIVDPRRPERIKVGRTTNLKQRMKGLFWEVANGECELEVIAIARTPDYATLETALHQELHDYWIEREWYESTPVKTFLDWIEHTRKPIDLSVPNERESDGAE